MKLIQIIVIVIGFVAGSCLVIMLVNAFLHMTPDEQESFRRLIEVMGED